MPFWYCSQFRPIKFPLKGRKIQHFTIKNCLAVKHCWLTQWWGNANSKFSKQNSFNKTKNHTYTKRSAFSVYQVFVERIKIQDMQKGSKFAKTKLLIKNIHARNAGDYFEENWDWILRRIKQICKLPKSGLSSFYCVKQNAIISSQVTF